MKRAYSQSTCPNAEAVTPRGPRTSSGNCNVSSRPAMLLLRPWWLIPRASAALLMLP
jgi:hypothetical protein